MKEKQVYPPAKPIYMKDLFEWCLGQKLVWVKRRSDNLAYLRGIFGSARLAPNDGELDIRTCPCLYRYETPPGLLTDLASIEQYYDISMLALVLQEIIQKSKGTACISEPPPALLTALSEGLYKLRQDPDKATIVCPQVPVYMPVTDVCTAWNQLSGLDKLKITYWWYTQEIDTFNRIVEEQGTFENSVVWAKVSLEKSTGDPDGFYFALVPYPYLRRLTKMGLATAYTIHPRTDQQTSALIRNSLAVTRPFSFYKRNLARPFIHLKKDYLQSFPPASIANDIEALEQFLHEQKITVMNPLAPVPWAILDEKEEDDIPSLLVGPATRNGMPLAAISAHKVCGPQDTVHQVLDLLHQSGAILAPDWLQEAEDIVAAIVRRKWQSLWKYRGYCEEVTEPVVNQICELILDEVFTMREHLYSQTASEGEGDILSVMLDTAGLLGTSLVYGIFEDTFVSIARDVLSEKHHYLLENRVIRDIVSVIMPLLIHMLTVENHPQLANVMRGVYRSNQLRFGFKYSAALYNALTKSLKSQSPLALLEEKFEDPTIDDLCQYVDQREKVVQSRS